MESHPDRGGDAGEFRRAQEAFAVLSCPKRRRHYDETGETAKPEWEADPVLAEIAQSIMAVVAWVVQHNRDAAREDLLFHASNFLKQQAEGNAKGVAAAKMTVRALEAAKDRLESEDEDGENYLRSIAEAHLAAARKTLEVLEAKGKALKEAKNRLKKCKFRREGGGPTAYGAYEIVYQNLFPS